MATRYGNLKGLDDSPRTKVFRAIDDLLRNDPTIRNIITKPGSFRSWQGDTNDKADFGLSQAPAIRLTPQPEPEQWWYPATTKGFLTITFEVITPGLAIDDVDNLVYAMHRVLVPHSDPASVQTTINKLKDAGAVTGLVQFSMPAYDPRPADGLCMATGQFRLELQTSA